MPGLIYKLQDLELNDYYSQGEVGQYYLALVNKRIMRELQRRKTFALPDGTIPAIEVIKAIKQCTDITEVLEQFTAVFTYKGKWTYRCTLHGEDLHPSGVIYRDTNSCYCFACQKGGDVINVVKLFSNMDTGSAITYLCKFYGIKPDILPAEQYSAAKEKLLEALQ